MINLLYIFSLKLLDTSLSALKTIYMIKNKHTLSALFNALSYAFYILLFKKLMSSNDTVSIIVTCASIFFGQLITQTAIDKLEKDRVWKISITPHSLEEGQVIADKLKDCNIPVKTYSCYTKDNIKVLAVTAFSQTREQSAIVNDILSDHCNAKFDIIEIKNRF